jgi:hypothetical protein
MRFSFYPIERIEQGAHKGGADDDDFDLTLPPQNVALSKLL